MLSLLLKPLRQTVRVLVAHDSPRQIAAGVAIGVALGLVPKGNLIAVTLGGVLLGLRVNRSAGLATAAACSWIGLFLDGFFHDVGAGVLAAPGLQSAYAWLYDQPLGPWLAFNNTVVIGSLSVGAYLAYPAYLLTHWVVERYQAPAARALTKYRVARALLGLDVSARLGGAGGES